MAVTKLLRTYKFLRQEHEAILQLKQLIPSRKIPKGLLEQGAAGISAAIASFENAKKADSTNERRPSLPNAAPKQFKPTKFKVTTGGSAASSVKDDDVPASGPAPMVKVTKDSGVTPLASSTPKTAKK